MYWYVCLFVVNFSLENFGTLSIYVHAWEQAFRIADKAFTKLHMNQCRVPTLSFRIFFGLMATDGSSATN